MIAALGAIVLHRKSCLQPSPEQFLNLWISKLPLKVDSEEGRRVHGDFVDLLVQVSKYLISIQLGVLVILVSFVLDTCENVPPMY